MQDARAGDRERTHELHALGFGGSASTRQALLAQTWERGVVVARDIDERSQHHRRVVGLAGRVEGLCSAPAQLDVIGACL